MSLRLEDVLAARTRLGEDVHTTPLLQSRLLSEKLGCDVHIKAEFLQKTGAFKPRGVLNYLRASSLEHPIVTTFSSGNHGQALAWAAQRHQKQAVIFMPEDASPAKVAAVRQYGGEVRRAGLSSTERESACRAFAETQGAKVVPPYDHEHIIAGQGTVMLEIVTQLPLFDAVLVPTGGGGLLSGNALTLSHLRQHSEVFACEPELAADAQASLKSGNLQSIEYPSTIADGTRNLCLGQRNWAIVKRFVREGLVCSEAQIIEAMAYYATYLKQVVEPSGAVSLACLIANRERFKGKTVVLIASGGNIALPDFGRLIQQYVASDQ